MKKIHILVEGQTEKVFVDETLAPHLWTREITIVPKVVVTKQMKSGMQFKGGVTSYGKIKDGIHCLLADSSAALVTTMIDYYGLPEDAPGYAARPMGTCQARVEHLERAIAEDIDHPRFLPNLMLHEFEALLFVDPSAYTHLFSDNVVIRNKLDGIRKSFTSPEEIDEGPATAPSKRLLNEFPTYHKTLHGPAAAAAIGLDKIRGCCAHFRRWLETLERC